MLAKGIQNQKDDAGVNTLPAFFLFFIFKFVLSIQIFFRLILSTATLPEIVNLSTLF